MAQIIDGKMVASKLKDEMKIEVASLKESGIEPHLAVVLVGDDPASQIYVNAKQKAALEVGIKSTIIRLAQDADQEKVEQVVEELNLDKHVSAILVQLPLPAQIDKDKIINLIDPSKDVDGFTKENNEKLLTSESVWPCTPKGIIKLLKEYNIDFVGKKIAVIGRSQIVGAPLAKILSHLGANVTVCHSQTPDVKSVTLESDIVIVAVGKRNLLTADMVKDGVVVIDVGINKKEDGKLCGDCDFENIFPKASYITPVPGGVGPMTIAMLLKNTILCAKKHL